jgi:DNA primase
MISQKSVQTILDTVRIEDIVGDFVTLKRKGANLGGLCPFHNEKTPSFNVSPVRNIFKCFGCGEGGDAVTFLIKHESLSYPDALRYIAKKYNIAIEETQVTQEFIAEKQLTDSLYVVNERALKFFQDQLFDTERGRSVGLAYFKQRGFREETIRKWGLGFAPENNDSLTKTLTSEAFDIDLLRKLGLTSQYDRDFFRARVMFTIHSLAGKPLAFAGRIMQKDTNAPKYINSPETEIYFKSKILFGIYQARKAIQTNDECVLCEGYTDVISLHQAGIENVVASSGTSLTTDQVRQIKRFTPNIKIIYDGDAAGIKAALRGMDMVLEEDMNVKIVLLPDKEDPDSYVQRVGATAFQEYINSEAKDFIFFKTQLLVQEAANDPIKKAALVKDIVTSIAKIPDPVKRQLYTRECAGLMRVEEGILVGEVGKIIRKGIDDKRFRTPPTGQPTNWQNPKPNPPASQPPATPPSVDDSFPSAPPPQFESHYPVDNQRVTHQNTFESAATSMSTGGAEFQEKDIVRLLIVSGAEVYSEAHNMSVAAYILRDIEDVINDFDNKFYQKIAHETLAELQKRPLSTQFFLTHSDTQIREFAASVLSSPYDYSENWEGKFHRPLESQKAPDKNFTMDSEQALKRFKLKKIIHLCGTNQAMVRQMSDAGDMPNMMKHLKIQQKLNEMRNLLAAELKTVILK